MYIEMNEEQASAVIAAMSDRIHQLENDNEYLRDALVKRMHDESAAAPEAGKSFNRSELESWLSEVEGDE